MAKTSTYIAQKLLDPHYLPPAGLRRMRKQLKETQKRLDNEKRTRLRAEEKLGAVIKQVPTASDTLPFVTGA